VDFENSGLLDLFVANGHIYPEVDTHGLGTRYRQRKQVFRNLGNKRFQEITDQVGGGVLLERSSRGAAFGDYDNDGDIDVLVVNLDDRPSLLRNDTPAANHWVTLQLVGSKSNRDAIGARVTVAGLVLVRQRPGTAQGVIFMTLEDETDIANIIVWPKVFAKNRRTVMSARFLAVRGRLQRAGLVIHVVAQNFIDLSAELPWLREGGDLFSPKFSGGPLPPDAALPLKSRDFH